MAYNEGPGVTVDEAAPLTPQLPFDKGKYVSESTARAFQTIALCRIADALEAYIFTTE